MSVLYASDNGFYISHQLFIQQCYQNVQDQESMKSYALKSDIFKIINQFTTTNSENRKHRRKLKRSTTECSDSNNLLQEEVNNVKQLYEKFYNEIKIHGLLEQDKTNHGNKNSEALNAAENIYYQTGCSVVSDAFGKNDNKSITRFVNDQQYLFPTNCTFFCKNVRQLDEYLGKEKYHLILLDPPWWNKYIRRKKAKTDHGYKMIYSSDLKELPLKKLLDDDGLIVVWCTNSQQHLNILLDDVFESWNVKFVAKWYWMKVTISGQPICQFSCPPGKQPFEQIVFGARNIEKYKHVLQTNGKIVTSIPSALHSHKPPLQELLQPYLPKDPNCLEIFARYLLPNWTSYGLEALRFQHSCLYDVI